MTTLEHKIGQMLVFGWQEDGLVAPEGEDFRLASHARALIEELCVGGVVLFSRNGSSADQVRGATCALQQLARHQGLPPLFVWVNHEGGPVQRFRGDGFTRLPSASQVGLTNSTKQAADHGQLAGEELKAVGVSGNFAPVLDVNNNPANPVIGERSYGDNPDLVAQLGAAAIQSMQVDSGIMACGKHFPGHGDTDLDSHLALPRIPHDRDRLDIVELVPFRAAIRSQVAAIMSAHILFPAIDPVLPATLSPRILTGLLRRELGFEGLCITDCLEMKGVAAGWGTPEAAVLAVLAGADILLCCHTWTAQKDIREALLSAVRSGQIPEERIDESLARIGAAKSKWLSDLFPG